jgi:hypothetical protein
MENEAIIEINFETNKTLSVIYDYLKITLKITTEKWTKFIANEENKQQLLNFLIKKDSQKLIINYNKTGNICVSNKYPLQFNTKICYFIKRNKNEAILNTLDPQTFLFFGSVSKFSLKQFDSILNNISTFFSNKTEGQHAYSVALFNDLKFNLKHIKSTLNTFSRLTYSDNDGIFSLLVEKIRQYDETSDKKW